MNWSMLKTTAYIHFLKSGGLCTIQDQGRFGFAEYGVPYSGAMDQFSLMQGNVLLRNQKKAAALEIGISGPKMVFEMPTRIVFTGALAEIFHNGKPIQLGQIVNIACDDEIKIGKFFRGQWLYMALEGGLETPIFMDSRSWYSGISSQSRLKKGDSICYLSEEKYHSDHFSHPKLDGSWFKDKEIEVYKGPEWKDLTLEQQSFILNSEFKISPISNRMGIQLEGNVSNQLKEILTSPVYPGTVQLTPSGKLIVLMRDAQVTGGYPRVFQLSDQAINIISQKNFGEKVKFSII